MQILNRNEMKYIMAGSIEPDCSCDKSCPPNQWPVTCGDACGTCAGKGERGSCKGCI